MWPICSRTAKKSSGLDFPPVGAKSSSRSPNFPRSSTSASSTISPLDAGNVLEIDRRRRRARHLIGGGEIDRHSRLELQRVDARAAVEQGFRAAIGDDVVARPAIDRVRPARAVERVVARPAIDQVGRRRAREIDPFGRAERARVDERVLQERSSEPSWP